MRDRNWKCLHRLWFRLLIKKILLKISNLKKLLVWCHNLVKLVVKEKWMYSGYIAFDCRGLRSFGYDSFRNIVHLGLDNSFIISYWRNKFLVLDEGLTDGINRGFGSPVRKFSINFTNSKTKICLDLHCSVDNSYFFVNGKNI